MKIAALVAVAACLLGGLALAESPVAPTTPCPAGNDVTQRHLLGLWRATFDALTQRAKLLLERHPEIRLDFKSLSVTVPGMRLACRCSSKIAGA